MILDHDLQFSDAQALLTSGVSEKTLGLGARGGQNLITVLATVVEGFAFTGAGGTLTIQIQSADNEAFDNPTTLAASGSLPLIGLTRGAMPLCIALPQGCGDFVRLYYDVTLESGTTVTAGKISASLVLDVPVLF